MPNPTLPETLAELNNLCQFFMQAQNGLQSGVMADLSGIDRRVSDVCRIVQGAIPEQQQQYLPELNTLIALLNGYEESLKSMKSQLNEAPTDAAQP